MLKSLKTVGGLNEDLVETNIYSQNVANIWLIFADYSVHMREKETKRNRYRKSDTLSDKD